MHGKEGPEERGVGIALVAGAHEAQVVSWERPNDSMPSARERRRHAERKCCRERRCLE